MTRDDAVRRSCDAARDHELKTWPAPFRALRDGTKTYEIRVNDRDFRVGDTLTLREYSSVAMVYTGETERRRITYMTNGGEWGLPDNMCVLALSALTAAPEVVEPCVGMRVREPADPHGCIGTVLLAIGGGWGVAWDEYVTGAFQCRDTLAEDIRDGSIVIIHDPRKVTP